METAAIVRWPGPVTKVFEYRSLRDALAADDRAGMEGMCVRYLDRNHIVKVKQEDYVRLHRIITGLSERTVWEHMCGAKPISDLLAPLPDELHDWTREVWDRIDLAACRTSGDAFDVYSAIIASLPSGWTRGDYAEQAKRAGALTPLLFQILDGKDPRPSILRNLKPEGAMRAKAVSEATA